jgi:hypothetical protein
MSITLVQSKSTNQSSGSSLGLAFDSSVTGGNAIIVAVLCDLNPSTPTISDGVNTYTALSEVSFTSSSSVSLRLFYAFGVASGATTVTATAGSGDVLSIAIHEYSGIIDYDTSVSNTGAASNTQPAGSITTSHAIELLFAATAVVTGSGAMIAQNADTGDGFTKEQTSPSGGVIFSLWTQDKTVSLTGSYSFTSSCTFTKGGGAQNFAVQLASFYGPSDATVSGTGAASTTAAGIGTVVLKPTAVGASSTAAGTCGTITATAHVAGVGASSTVSGTCGALPLKGVGASATILAGTGEVTASALVTGVGSSSTSAGSFGSITGTAALTGVGGSTLAVGSCGTIILKPHPAGASATGAASCGSIELVARVSGSPVTCLGGFGSIITTQHVPGVGAAVTCLAGVGDITCNSAFPMIAFLGM